MRRRLALARRSRAGENPRGIISWSNLGAHAVPALGHERVIGRMTDPLGPKFPRGVSKHALTRHCDPTLIYIAGSTLPDEACRAEPWEGVLASAPPK
jgi:hypothetical protein